MTANTPSCFDAQASCAWRPPDEHPATTTSSTRAARATRMCRRYAYGRRNSPRATITALPPTSTRSSCSAVPSARANSVEGRPISTPCVISISSPNADSPVAREVHRERSRGRAGRRVLCNAAARREHPRAPLRALAREAVDAEQARQGEQRARRQAAAPRARPPSRARRRRTARRCRSARPAAPTDRARAPRAAPRPRRTASRSAAAGPCVRRRSARRRARARPARCLDRVSSRISASCNGPPSTKAVPSVG